MYLKGEVSNVTGAMVLVTGLCVIFKMSLDQYPWPIAVLLILTWLSVPITALICRKNKIKDKFYWGIYTLIFYIATGFWRVLLVPPNPELSTSLSVIVVQSVPFVMIGFSLKYNIKLLHRHRSLESHQPRQPIDQAPDLSLDRDVLKP